MTYGPTDRAVRLEPHRLTPADVERIVDALEVDNLAVIDGDALWRADAEWVSTERITAALCGGTESDYA